MTDDWINVFGGQLRSPYNPPQDLSCNLCGSLDHAEMECPVLDNPVPLTREEIESMALYAEESCAEEGCCDHEEA